GFSVFLGRGVVLLLGTVLGIFAGILALVRPAPAPSAAPPAAAPGVPLAILVGALAVLLVLGALVLILVERDIVILVLGEGFEARDRGRARPGAGDAHLGAFLFPFGENLDDDAIALLDLGEIGALGVEEVHRRFGGGVERDRGSLALGRFVLDQAQGGQARAGGGADKAGAVTMRAAAR